jgi:hypothetical protein
MEEESARAPYQHEPQIFHRAVLAPVECRPNQPGFNRVTPRTVPCQADRAPGESHPLFNREGAPPVALEAGNGLEAPAPVSGPPPLKPRIPPAPSTGFFSSASGRSLGTSAAARARASVFRSTLVDDQVLGAVRPLGQDPDRHQHHAVQLPRMEGQAACEHLDAATEAVSERSDGRASCVGGVGAAAAATAATAAAPAAAPACEQRVVHEAHEAALWPQPARAAADASLSLADGRPCAAQRDSVSKGTGNPVVPVAGPPLADDGAPLAHAGNNRRWLRPGGGSGPQQTALAASPTRTRDPWPAAGSRFRWQTGRMKDLAVPVHSTASVHRSMFEVEGDEEPSHAAAVHVQRTPPGDCAAAAPSGDGVRERTGSLAAVEAPWCRRHPGPVLAEGGGQGPAASSAAAGLPSAVAPVAGVDQARPRVGGCRGLGAGEEAMEAPQAVPRDCGALGLGQQPQPPRPVLRSAAGQAMIVPAAAMHRAKGMFEADQDEGASGRPFAMSGPTEVDCSVPRSGQQLQPPRPMLQSAGGKAMSVSAAATSRGARMFEHERSRGLSEPTNHVGGPTVGQRDASGIGQRQRLALPGSLTTGEALSTPPAASGVSSAMNSAKRMRRFVAPRPLNKVTGFLRSVWPGRRLLSQMQRL